MNQYEESTTDEMPLEPDREREFKEAQRILQMSDMMVRMVGGMSKAKARDIVREYERAKAEKARATRARAMFRASEAEGRHEDTVAEARQAQRDHYARPDVATPQDRSKPMRQAQEYEEQDEQNEVVE